MTDRVPAWARFAEDYETRVVSITKFPRFRERIRQHIRDGRILDLGTGPLGRLPNDLVLQCSLVVASDFSIEMLLASRRRTAGRVAHIAAEHGRLPLRSGSLSTVISVNSILPEERGEIPQMFREVARALVEGGVFIAILPAFEMSLLARDRWSMDVVLDHERHREFETSGWQSFYTREDIVALMAELPYRHYQVERLTFDLSDEIDHVISLYGGSVPGDARTLFTRHPLFEHLLIAVR